MPNRLELTQTLGVDAGIRRVAARFRAGGLAEPDADARILVLAALGLSRADALRDPDAALGAGVAQIRDWVGRRLSGEPVSRILGRKEFWGLDFIVTPAVLDPRPDTETLVSTALELCAALRAEAIRIADFGTGSGALACALLSEFRAASAVAIDASPEACAIARLNVERLEFSTRCRVDCVDWANFAEPGFDLVVANPPYIPTADLATLDREVRDYDPRTALDGGADGLAAYRLIAARAIDRLSPGGFLMTEVGAGQSAAVAALFESVGLVDIVLRRDLAGIDRVVAARRRGVHRIATVR